MDKLWSITTTIREAERIPAFLKTAKEIENWDWNEESQIRFQTLLIKNREFLYKDDTLSFKKLSSKQIELLKDKNKEISYEDAKSIFETKEYKDPPMRGRQSMSPLEKLGLVDKSTGRVIITDVGNKLLNNEITFDEFMFEALLKLQYPNPIEKEHKNWNSKPFINALRLIKKVNELCRENKTKEKGLTQIEFGIFALSIKKYTDVEDIAKKVIEFRTEFEALASDAEKENYKNKYIADYLSSYENPEKNIKEYTDNIVRYMRITKYIYIRGKYGHSCIDLEPRRMIEINSILASDSGAAVEFSKENWINYFGTFGTYDLPFDTVEKLQEIFNENLIDINKLEEKLNIPRTMQLCPKVRTDIKSSLIDLRTKRVKLQNLEIKHDFSNDISKIDEAIESLKNIRKLDLKPSIALEKWSNIALNIINDSLLIKPNSIVGDDNEPTFTAPAGVPDIECFYDSFNSICEVTMLTGRDQWFNEGQPVMRHLRDFENSNIGKECYCLFIAPSLHTDTISTYFTSVKSGYDGVEQKIIPITIAQFIELIKVVSLFKQDNKEFKHSYIKDFYDRVLEIVEQTKSHSTWQEKIPSVLNSWTAEMQLLAA